MASVAVFGRNRAFRRAGIKRGRGWLLSALVVAAALVIPMGGPFVIALLLSLGSVVAIVALTVRMPQIAILGLAIWVPLQQPVLAYLFKLGAPVLVVKYLGYFKEFWAMALVIAAVRATRQRRIKADYLDWIAASYVALATAYLLLPFAEPGILGGLSFAARLNAWRTGTLYVVLFLCIRRLTFDASVVRRLRLALFVVAIILAGFSVWEITSTDGFENFLQNTLGYGDYKARVLHVTLARAGMADQNSTGNTSYVRAGSLFADTLQFGFFMVIPLGIALERIAARRQTYIGMAGAAAGLMGVMFSLTRGAVLGAMVSVALALVFGVSRVAPNRLRLVLAVLLGAALLLPFAKGSALVTRMESVFNPSHDQSDTQLHVTRSKAGYAALRQQPLGRGLGANLSTSLVYGGDISISTENSYLSTGNEIGFAGALLLLGSLGALLIKLRARSRLPGEAGGLAGGAWLAGCGLTIGAFFLPTWYELPVSLVFWSAAGLALADVVETRRA